MLSVLLLGFDRAGRGSAAPGEAVRTLSALVPAAVDGVVRDLCLAGPDEAGLAEVAEHAGCGFVPVPRIQDSLLEGAQRLRATHVLVIHAGTVIDRAVIDEMASILPLLGNGMRVSWVLKAAGDTLVRRLIPALAPTAGVICSRAWLMRPQGSSLAALARRAEGRRTLKATALLGA